MKVKKSLLIFALILAIGVLNACESAKNKVIEKATEKAVEKATGSKIDVKNDGIKVSNESGTYESGDNMKWPADKMGDLPQPKGKITTVLSDDKSKGCTIGYSGCELKDAQNYVDALKKLGYGNGAELADKDGIMFSGQKADGSTVNFTYNVNQKDGAISYAKTENSMAETSKTGQNGSQTPPAVLAGNPKITVTAPAGWDKVEGSTAIAQYLKEGSSFIVTVDNMPSDAGTPDAFVNYVKERYNKTFKEVKFESMENVKIAGIESRKLVYTCKISGISMKFNVYYAFKDKKAYTFTCGSLADRYDGLKGDYEVFMSSVKFE